MKLLTLPSSQSALANLEDLPLTLELLQQKVGGFIEAVRFPDQGLVMYINEEGKLDGLAPNPRATEICRENSRITRADWISGPAVFLREGEDGEDTGLLSSDVDWISSYLERYK